MRGTFSPRIVVLDMIGVDGGGLKDRGRGGRGALGIMDERVQISDIFSPWLFLNTIRCYEYGGDRVSFNDYLGSRGLDLGSHSVA